MKKVILVFAAVAISFGAYAQAGSTNRTNNPQDNKSQNRNLQNRSVDESHSDGVMMQNGKVMKMERGEMTTLDNDMTMSNGTKIMSDGSYIRKDGTKMKLKEGQHINMEGNLSFRKVDKDKNMYLVPDSLVPDSMRRKKDF